jgi:hypothetical protein
MMVIRGRPLLVVPQLIALQMFALQELIVKEHILIAPTRCIVRMINVVAMHKLIALLIVFKRFN